MVRVFSWVAREKTNCHRVHKTFYFPRTPMILRAAVFCLLLATLVFGTPTYNPKMVVSLPIEISPSGTPIVVLAFGTPSRLGRFMLDFQSDYSGTWTEDLASSRSFCDDCAPITRDIINIGPYSYYFEMRSVPRELANAQATGTRPAYIPPMIDAAANGWLALGPLSEIWKVWDAFIVDPFSLTLAKHPLIKSKRQSFLTEFDRTFPNVPMRMHDHARWWHRGWLATSPKEGDYHTDDSERVKRRLATDAKWLNAHHGGNLTFVLFGNKTKTELPQQFFDSLFFRANLYNPVTMPGKICLAPGLYMKHRDWFHHDSVTGQNSLSVDLLPRPAALEMLSAHPIQDVYPENIVSLSINSMLRGYRVKAAPDSREIAFIPMQVNDHITTANLFLILILVFLFAVIFLSQMVYLHSVVIRSGMMIRLNVRNQLEIGFRSKGFWLMQLIQVFSAAAVLTAYWTSDKLDSMRTNSDHVSAQVIYWFITIFINVTAFAEVCNVLLLTFASLKIPDYKEVQKTRARIFVITYEMHTQTLLLAIWIVLMSRTSTDLTNLPASIYSIALVIFAVASPLILLDRLLHPTSNDLSQLWYTSNTNAAAEYQQPPQAWSYAYAVGTIAWLTMWAIWIVVFASYLQIYEEIHLSMPDMSDLAIIFMSLTIVALVVEFGVEFLTEYKITLNHTADFDRPADK
jgi:hypothetical protein